MTAARPLLDGVSHAVVWRLDGNPDGLSHVWPSLISRPFQRRPGRPGARPHRRRRTRDRRDPDRLSRARRPAHSARGRRPPRAGTAPAAQARPRAARRADAARRRLESARRNPSSRRHARDHADRARPGHRQAHGPAHRRRRLRGEAVQSRRSRRACAGGAAPFDGRLPPGRAARAAGRAVRDRPRTPRSHARSGRRTAHARADAHRIRCSRSSRARRGACSAAPS